MRQSPLSSRTAPAEAKASATQPPAPLGPRRLQGLWRSWLWTLGADVLPAKREGGGAIQDGANQALDAVLQAWQTPGRHYHSLAHLGACLTLLREWARPHGLTPSEEALLGLALCFHDAVYDPRRDDNEVRSAELARELLRGVGLPAGSTETVVNLVLMTAHGHVLEDVCLSRPLVSLLLDIDLAVLGADEATFAQYEQDIRQEYAWVDAERYRQGRAQVLSSFLPRQAGGRSGFSHVYRTEVARAQREGAAQANLRRALAAL